MLSHCINSKLISLYKKYSLTLMIAALIAGCGGGSETPIPTPINLTKTQVVQTLNQEGLDCQERDYTITNPNNGSQYISVPIRADISCVDPSDGMTALILYGEPANPPQELTEYNGAPFDFEAENVTSLSSTTEINLVKALANQIISTTPAPGMVILGTNEEPHIYQSGEIIDIFGVGEKRVFMNIYNSLNNIVGNIEVQKDDTGNYLMPQLETVLNLTDSYYTIDFRILNEWNVESLFSSAGAYQLSTPPAQGGTGPNDGGGSPGI